MTVKELIDALANANPNAEVHLATWPVRENPPTIWSLDKVYVTPEIATLEATEEVSVAWMDS